MNNLEPLIKKLEQCKITLCIRNKLYNRVVKNNKGHYTFTNTESSDCLTTSETWLRSLMCRGLLYGVLKPVSTINSTTAVNSANNKQSIKQLQLKHSMSIDEASELQQLLIDMKPLNFDKSAQLSSYIARSKLGYKYPTISGIARMSDGEHQWNFDGGFPKNIYRIICTELCLSNQGSRATVVGFTSYNSIDE
jgi:hypothetical protein